MTIAPPRRAAAPLKKRRWLTRLNRGLLVVLTGLGLILWAWPSVGGGRPDNLAASILKRWAYASIPVDDEAGFTRLDPHDPGPWLSVFAETPQPLTIYRWQKPRRPTATRRTLVLQPLGPMNAEQTQVIQAMREYMEAFFQLPTRIEKPLDLALAQPWARGAASGHGVGKRQYDAGQILDKVLAPRLPADACAYLGITMADLWAGKLNYVFGLGSGYKRVGVYSLCRYYPEFWGRKRAPGDEVRGLRRACQVLNHETGHVFTLGHCVFYHCSMNGSNSLSQSDAAPLDYCPVCHRKLLWNIGFDGVKRYEALASFYRKHGMQEEAQWVMARSKRWKRIAAREK